MSTDLGGALPELIEGLVDSLADPDPDAPATPWIGDGRGGAAFALWRHGAVTGDAAAIAAAREIVDSLRRDVADRDGRPGVVYGRAGIAWLEHLLGRPESAPPAPAPGEADELVGGTAGRLLAAAHGAALGNAGARDAGHAAAAALELSRGEQAIAWAHLERVGIAHGVAGVHVAWLGWLDVTGGEPSDWLIDSLDALLARAVVPGRWPVSLAPGAAPSFGWCNGSPGMAMLWVKAYERTGAARYLEAARAAGEVCWSAPSGAIDLCCGAIGEAYALAMLARVDSRADWRDRVVSRAAIALAEPLPNPGLLKGDAGALCLASDLQRDRVRVPLLEP